MKYICAVEAHARVGRFECHLDGRDAVFHRSRRLDVQVVSDRGRRLRGLGIVAARDAKGNSSFALDVTAASQLSTCGSTAAAKAQPLAQDLAQSSLTAAAS